MITYIWSFQVKHLRVKHAVFMLQYINEKHLVKSPFQVHSASQKMLVVKQVKMFTLRAVNISVNSLANKFMLIQPTTSI